MRGSLIGLLERLVGLDEPRRTFAMALCARTTWRFRYLEHGFISDHALDQLTARKICRPDRFEKVVSKAWRSRETSRRLRRLAKRDRHRHLRLFSGCIYVFAKERNTITLVTVIRPGAE